MSYERRAATQVQHPHTQVDSGVLGSGIPGAFGT
jgi:hypothetical protein